MVLGIGFCVATADLSTNIIKHKVQRYRPSHNLEIMAQVHTVNDYHGGQFGFFSSHAANSFAVVTLLFLAAKGLIANKFRYTFYVLPTLIIYSRIYLGVHYPTDVMVGAVWGILIGWLIFSLLTRFFLKNKRVEIFFLHMSLLFNSGLFECAITRNRSLVGRTGY